MAGKRKGLIVGGAAQPRPLSQREAEFIARYDYLVAADGGLRFLRYIDRAPDLWVGDGDSVSGSDIAWARDKQTKIHLFPFSKDYLDSELAIRMISECCSEIGLVGLWGSRPDQSFSVIPLLVLATELGLSAEVFFGAPETETLMGICRGPCERVFSSALHDRWSFIGLTDCYGVSLRGFAYELNHETVFRNLTRTVSNRAVVEQVKVAVENGDLLYFHLLDAVQET